MMNNSNFRNKTSEGASEYLDQLAENAQHQDIVGFYESSSKPQPSPSCESMYKLRENHDLQTKFASIARKVKALQ